MPLAPKGRAGNGIRTRDINLGKVALYQLSYSRIGKANIAKHSFLCKLTRKIIRKISMIQCGCKNILRPTLKVNTSKQILSLK